VAAEISAAKFNAPAIQALRIVERRGYKTSVVKKPGELTRYIAKRAGGLSHECLVAANLA
jgi:hypothetical protein